MAEGAATVGPGDRLAVLLGETTGELVNGYDEDWGLADATVLAGRVTIFAPPNTPKPHSKPRVKNKTPNKATVGHTHFG